MKIKIEKIERDTSIQCRASIDTGIVLEYAESMKAGDTFPPVDLFGKNGQFWIGDGWHRIMAADQAGAKEISANVHPGGRIEALKWALTANALHGHRRTNADKHRCVEIALREFPKLSSRAIAEMCGVSNHFVDSIRPAPTENESQLKRIGQDGRERPASRPKPEEQELEKKEEDEEAVTREPRKVGPPCDGMQFARLAIMDLEQIRSDDAERQQAFECVKEWIGEHEREA